MSLTDTAIRSEKPVNKAKHTFGAKEKHLFLSVYPDMLSSLHLIVLFLTFSIAWTQASGADAFNKGPKECNECHEAEYDVWKKTPHFKSYKSVHKKEEAKKILKAIGVKAMKKSDDCTLCHYTKIQKAPGETAKVKAGPSCESCHNPASEWMDIHNDYGGPDVKAKDETPAHREKRLADAANAGMIASRMVYDIASSCMRCHGLANPNLKADSLATMLEAGHPVKDEFEVVSYSQGKLRHRFTPPDGTTNNKLDAAGTARLFIGGQAAAFVAASRVMDKSSNPKFKAVQKKRLDSASKNLQALADKVPAIKALLANPSDENGRKLAEALEGKDLSADVAGMLPKESDYK